jgi:HD superfamily phosphodiesterase
MSATLRKKVLALTEEYGGEYALQHAQRLIRLVETIADGADYDQDAIWLAAHMHDWGTLPRWSRADISHSRRSRDLAADTLRKFKCPAPTAERVLEAIEFHHGGADDRCIEAILLRDADALDGMGAMGVLREFASIPTEIAGCYTLPTGWGMRGAYDRSVIRLENNPGMLRLPKSKQLARAKAKRMKAVLDALDAESFGCL